MLACWQWLAPEHLAPSSKTLESHPVAVPPCGTLRRWQSLTINSPQPANQGDRGPRSTKHVHIRPNQMEGRQEVGWCGWSHRFLMKARQPPALQAITSWQGRSDTEGALSRLLRIVVCKRITFLRKDKLRVDSGRSAGFEFDSQGTFNYFCHRNNPPDLSCCHIIFLSVFL